MGFGKVLAVTVYYIEPQNLGTYRQTLFHVPHTEALDIVAIALTPHIQSRENPQQSLLNWSMVPLYDYYRL